MSEAQDLNVTDEMRETAKTMLLKYVSLIADKGRADQIIVLTEVVDALIDGRYVKVETAKKKTPLPEPQKVTAEKCSHCRGFGYTKGSAHGPWDQVNCTECNGSGKKK